MTFQSLSGIEQNKKVQTVLALVLLMAAFVFIIHAKLQTPNKNAVDGKYQNECCTDIAIRNGRVSYGGSAADMKLSDMKFGLTGYVKGRFTSRGIEPSTEPTAMAFADQDGTRTVSLPVDRQMRTFVRAGAVSYHHLTAAVG